METLIEDEPPQEKALAITRAGPVLIVSSALVFGIGTLLLGDWFEFYELDLIQLLGSLIVLAFASVTLLWIVLPRKVVLAFIGAAILFYLSGIAFRASTASRLEGCPVVQTTAIEESELQKRYRIKKVIQDITSASGNAIMIAENKSKKAIKEYGENVIVKYYADPNATESIAFACSLPGTASKVFPRTIEAGVINTTRGEALYTVQTMAEGQPIDLWIRTKPSEQQINNCALDLIRRMEQFTEDKFCHRDLHPGNIFVNEEGRLSFIDVDLGLVSTSNEDFVFKCQRFFFEMPLRLVKFARQNLEESKLQGLLAWWVFMTGERYGSFSIDQLYLVVCVFILTKRFKVLKSVSNGKQGSDLYFELRSAVTASEDKTTAFDIVPTSADLVKYFFKFQLVQLGMGISSSSIKMDAQTIAGLQQLFEDFQKTGTPPRINFSGSTIQPFSTIVVVNNVVAGRKLTIEISVREATDFSIASSQGPIYELKFSRPIRFSTRVMDLEVNYIRVDKSTQTETKFYVEGRGFAGRLMFNIQDVVGEISNPNGPLPTGNEIMQIMKSIKLNQDQMGDILKALGRIEMKVDRPEEQAGTLDFVVDFTDTENVTVSLK